MADQQDQISIDLANASDSDLLNIRNEIMKRLVARAKSPLMADYDRHGSGHSRSGGGIIMQPDSLAKGAQAGEIIQPQSPAPGA